MEGVVVVTGLDVGEYHFTETKAPEGYSINTDGAGTTISVLGESPFSFTFARTILPE